MLPQSFSDIIVLLCFTLHLVSSSPAATPQSASNPVSLLLNTTPSPSLNTSELLASKHTYRIPKTRLSLVLQAQFKASGVHDTLLLLVEALYAATERVNMGGTAATGAVDVFSHRYADVQLQIIGFRDLLTPFKIAQVVRGIAIMGEHTEYYLSSYYVLEDRLGQIAKVDMR